MTLDELLAALEHKSPPAPMDAVKRFEATIGQTLPDDYREFLIRRNGGYGCGYVQFLEPTPAGHAANACVNHVGGFREESYFSLESNYENYQKYEVRIPKALIWIADDPFGNAICLGVSDAHRGKVYFWDHENEPDPDEWDGSVERAENIDLLANSFSEFMAGLQKVASESWSAGITRFSGVMSRLPNKPRIALSAGRRRGLPWVGRWSGSSEPLDA